MLLARIGVDFSLPKPELLVYGALGPVFDVTLHENMARRGFQLPGT